MPFIQLIASIIILGLIYRRMLSRNPEPVERKQAIVPVILGVVSLPLSLIFVLGGSVLLFRIGYKGEGVQPILRSLVAAFITAGLPEELAKLLMMLLSFRLFRSRIKNVYECILIGAAVGFGFTILEEFAYGSTGLAAVLRLLTIAAHMCFGIVMSKHLGTAIYKKRSGDGGAAGDAFSRSSCRS